MKTHTLVALVLISLLTLISCENEDINLPDSHTINAVVENGSRYNTFVSHVKAVIDYGDVEFDVFCYFVNCMINAHFTKLDPVIKAWATIKNNENESYKLCNNQRALFYIPEEDTEHDNVFFTTENNKCFKLSFDNEDIVEVENIIHPFEFTPEKYLLLQDKEFEDFK